ncbi:MAG: class I SAM-dependent methyltransferase [Caldilineaceae bacterium]
MDVVEHGLYFRVDLAAGRRPASMPTNGRTGDGWPGAAGRTVLNVQLHRRVRVALAAGAQHVTHVDTSADALDLAALNTTRNGFDAGTSTQLNADVFQQLRTWRDQGPRAPRFDLIILDPPKFAQSKRSVDRALRGYKDINLLAMKLLAPDGILATFSCSGLVSAELFQKAVFAAAVDAGRPVQILEWLRQPADHPVAVTFPEGDYLKGFICRVL